VKFDFERLKKIKFYFRVFFSNSHFSFTSLIECNELPYPFIFPFSQ
jgi:hypothetical protein